MKIVFLYTELANYFLSCINSFALKYNAEIHLVHWPVNTEAPFELSFNNNIKAYNKNDFDNGTLLKLIESISPDVIYCSGWMDKNYLSACKKFRNEVPVIVGFDNKWKGSIKQRLGSALNNLAVNKYFSHCWIPGLPQLEFARRMGFDDAHTLNGFYSCDFEFFHALYLKYSEIKKKKFPHKLIFAGRYYDFKGVKNLWSAFIDIQNESPNDWELWCLGTGDIPPQKHRAIKHFGFVQPGDMEKYISETGVFVLPSTFEPWGVAVHEFAAAGFPLICSSEVGAASAFLHPHENGLLFQSGDFSALKQSLKAIIGMTDESLFSMGEKSAELAKQITPEKWSDTLMSVLKDSR